MKHPSSRAFYAYWDDKRGFARAPDRSELEPGPVRELLGDIFVLSYDPEGGFPFRVAGTRVCALLGRDVKGQSFPALFAAESRREMADLLGVVADEVHAVVAGVTARTADGARVDMELLLLPFNARAHAPLSLTGLLAPLLGHPGALGELTLTSWRIIEPRPEPFRSRAIRKLQVARGFIVYEGLR